MKQKITLTFDSDIAEQNVVYEFIKSKGRSKTKVVTDILFAEAQKENAFIVMKEQLIQAILEDERIRNILAHEPNAKKQEKKKSSLEKPKPVKQSKEEEIDMTTLMKGLEAFGV